MGAVYLAEHSHIGDRRALKVLLPEFTQNPDVVQRFINEARASGRLKHRNIVGVHDIGQLPDGSYYIVFEYVEGQTLAGLIDSGHGVPFPPREVVRYTSQIANAMRVAHLHEIVHRDLKPENVLLTVRDGDDRHVMVLDWGIAHLSNRPESDPRTQTGILLGTTVYMSPEQLLGQRVGPPTDVFALGTIAYRLATGGRFPYQFYEIAVDDYYQLTPAEICMRQRDHLFVDPRKHNPALQNDFVRALLAAFALDPVQRPRPEDYALMLADAAPPDGRHIVQTYARELLGAQDSLALSAGSADAAVARARSATGHKAPRYRLGHPLGVGGMAEVFLATTTSDEGMERVVAIKRVLPAFSRDEQFARMFRAEAQIAAQLKHSNIVAIEDFARDEDGQLFIAMEYVDGRDLDALAKTGPLPISVVIYVIAEVLYALRFAHNLPRGSGKVMRGVVHRDISPHNVLLSWEGAVKLSDFGLAKVRTDAVVAASVLLKGKPRYMSPEQARNFDLDGRSDLFAVGVMLWEMLTGVSLFDGQNALEVIQKVTSAEAIAPPSRSNSNVKSDLDRVTLTLLQRDLDKRCASAEVAIEALLGCADADPRGRSELVRLLAQRFPEAAEMRAPRSTPGSSAAPTAAALPSWMETSRTTHGAATGQAIAPPLLTGRNRWHWIAVAMVGVVAGIVALIAMQGGDSSPPAVAPNPAGSPGSSSPGAIDPQPARSQLTVVTSPAGALVRIDGVLKGESPLVIPVADGTRLTISADQNGFEGAQETVTMGPSSQTVSLRLRELAPPPAVAPPHPVEEKKHDTAKRVRPIQKKKQDTAEERGSRAGSGTIDRNGVSTNPDI